MKTNTRAITLICATGIIAAGCSSTGKLAREQASFSKDKVDARGLFVENCAKCHGEDGRAKTFRGGLTHAQDFTSAKWKSTAKTDDLVHTIQTGEEKMPAFQNKLSQAEIETLADYVQTFPAAQ